MGSQEHSQVGSDSRQRGQSAEVLHILKQSSHIAADHWLSLQLLHLHIPRGSVFTEMSCLHQNLTEIKKHWYFLWPLSLKREVKEEPSPHFDSNYALGRLRE